LGVSLTTNTSLAQVSITRDVIIEEEIEVDDVVAGPFVSDLQKGSSQNVVTQVFELQKVLKNDPSVYPQGVVTGYYGDLTVEAVTRFQMKHGLLGDRQGAVGQETRVLLNSTKEKRTAAEFNADVLAKKAAFEANSDQVVKNALRQALQRRKTAMARLVRVNKEKAAAFALAPNIRATLPEDLQKLVEERKIILGSSRAEHIDNFESNITVSRTVIEAGEEVYEVTGYIQQAGTIGTMRVEGVALDGIIAPLASPQISALQVEVVDTTLPEAKVAVIMFLAKDDRGSFDQAYMRGQMATITSYFNEISYGRKKVSFDIYGPYTSPTLKRSDLGGCNTAKQQDEALRLGDRDIDYREYTHFGIYTVGCSGAGYAAASVFKSNDQEAVVRLKGFLVSSFSAGHVSHEIGHTFGPGHASTLTCAGKTLLSNVNACTHGEYGDPYDVMGISGSMGHMNARHKLMWGALKEDEAVDVLSNGFFTITPLERAGGKKVLVITPGKGATGDRDPFRRFYIEFRQPIGLDAKFGSAAMQGAFLRGAGFNFSPFNGGTTHLLDGTPGGGGYFIPVGQSFTDPDPVFGGWTIKVLSAGGTAPDEKLVVELSDLPPPPKPLPFTFDLSLGALPASVKPGGSVTIPFTANLIPGSANPIDVNLNASIPNIQVLDGTYEWFKGTYSLNKDKCKPTCSGQVQITLSPNESVGTLRTRISVYYSVQDVPGYEDVGDLYSKYIDVQIPITQTGTPPPPPVSPPPPTPLPPPPPPTPIPPPPPVNPPPPTPVPPPTPSLLSMGDRMEVADTNILIARKNPMLTGPIASRQADGDQGVITAGPQVADGHVWWYIKYDSGAPGWSSETYLKKAILAQLSLNEATMSIPRLVVGGQSRIVRALFTNSTQSKFSNIIIRTSIQQGLLKISSYSKLVPCGKGAGIAQPGACDVQISVSAERGDSLQNGPASVIVELVQDVRVLDIVTIPVTIEGGTTFNSETLQMSSREREDLTAMLADLLIRINELEQLLK
ncbi:MAG: hypothetical protein EXS68_02210, partial [Candidatus Ryanbacteria bacterium]|nr:hypothetical protein [Candidatus Ryanbacteria bacterium]